MQIDPGQQRPKIRYTAYKTQEAIDMTSHIPVEKQRIEGLTLQEYADKYCGGDRFRAIHYLMLNTGEAGFDPYVDELTEEDANFAVCLLTMDMIRMYGKKGCYQLLKTNKLAASLGTTTDEVLARKKNPYTKGFLIGLILFAGAIGISVLLSCLDAVSRDVADIGSSVLIGLASMNLAVKLIPFMKYRKLRRMVAKLPEPDPDAFSKAPESFEEAMEFYREHMG